MVFQKLFGSPVDYLNMLHMLGSWYSNTHHIKSTGIQVETAKLTFFNQNMFSYSNYVSKKKKKKQLMLTQRQRRDGSLWEAIF